MIKIDTSIQKYESPQNINKILNRYDFTDENTKKQIEAIRKIAKEYIDRQI